MKSRTQTGRLYLLAVYLLVAVAVTGCGASKTEIAAVEKANQLEKQVGDLKTQNKGLQDRVGSLSAELGTKTTRIAVLEETIGDLNAKITAVESESKDLRKQVFDRENRVAALEAKKAKAAEAQRIADEAAAEAAAREAKKTNLTVQIGVTLNSGDTKPVTNETVYIINQPLTKLVPETFTQDDRVREVSRQMNAPVVNAAGVLKWSPLYRSHVDEVLARIRSGAVATSTTDFNGRAQFAALQPGDYYVLCQTAIGGGAVLQKRIHVEGKSTFVSLGNGDIENEFP